MNIAQLLIAKGLPEAVINGKSDRDLLALCKVVAPDIAKAAAASAKGPKVEVVLYTPKGNTPPGVFLKVSGGSRYDYFVRLADGNGMNDLARGKAKVALAAMAEQIADLLKAL